MLTDTFRYFLELLATLTWKHLIIVYNYKTTTAGTNVQIFSLVFLLASYYD